MFSLLIRKAQSTAGRLSTYVDGAVRHTKEEDRNGQLDLRGASIVYFGGFGVILPKWVHELPGLSCQESWWLDGWQILPPLPKPLPSHPQTHLPPGSLANQTQVRRLFIPLNRAQTALPSASGEGRAVPLLWSTQPLLHPCFQTSWCEPCSQWRELWGHLAQGSQSSNGLGSLTLGPRAGHREGGSWLYCSLGLPSATLLSS